MITRREFAQGILIAIGGMSLVSPTVLSFEGVKTKFIIAKMPISTYTNGRGEKVGGYKITGANSWGKMKPHSVQRLDLPPRLSWEAQQHDAGAYYIPQFEVASNPAVRLSDVNNKGHIIIYDIIKEAVDKISEQIQIYADDAAESYKKEHGKEPNYIIIIHEGFEILSADEPQELKLGYIVCNSLGIAAVKEVPEELSESYVKDSVYLGMLKIKDFKKVDKIVAECLRSAEGKLALNELIANSIKFV